jgi:hypothetical protein
MKLNKIELTQEQIIMIIAAAIAIIILLAYFILYVPLIGKLKVSYRECKTSEEEVLCVRGIIESAGKTQEPKSLIAEEDVSLAIDELTRCGKSMGINFISIKPREIINKAELKCKVLPIEIEIESKGEQFFEFLGSLDGLKNSLMRIKSFDLIPDKEDEARLHGRIIVEMYLSSGL